MIILYRPVYWILEYTKHQKYFIIFSLDHYVKISWILTISISDLPAVDQKCVPGLNYHHYLHGINISIGTN